MNSLLVGVSVLVVMVSGALALGYPYDDEFSEWRLARQSRRSSRCFTNGGKCFSTVQCCTGFVCAAFDDYFSMKPEVPGFCVREKDLEPCRNDRDCKSGYSCEDIGSSGETYCLQRPMQEPNGLPQMSYSKSRGTKGYGMRCSETSECASTDKAGNELCCQTVIRGRMGKKEICDRVTKLSSCI